MGRKLLIAGVVVGLLFPALFIVGMIAHWAMGCTGGGSSGPVHGCHVLGLKFNFIAAMATPAFVASFFTVPIGILLATVGGIASVIADFRQGPRLNQESQIKLQRDEGDDAV